MPYSGSQAFLPPVGTLLNLNTGSVGSPTWTSIAEVAKISPSGRKYSVEDTTNLSSSAKEKLTGLLDSGKIDVEYNYLQDTTQLALETAFVAGGVHQFEIIIPGLPGGKTETWTFSGIITDKNPDGIERDKPVKGKVTIDVTNAYTFAQA